MPENLGIIILAAGLGTRMKSDKAKVLHEICGRPMINYVVDTACRLAGDNVFLVVGHQAEQVRTVVGREHQVRFALQPEQLGTGHAVLCALPRLGDQIQDVVILCGDVPLIRPDTIAEIIDTHRNERNDVTLFVVAVDNPTGYGRVILDAGHQLTGIVEEADATAAQKKINIINTGIYVVTRHFLSAALPQLRADNAQKEIYLTDIIAIGHRSQRRMGVVTGRDPDEIIGINSPVELQRVENMMKNRSLEKY